MSKSKSRVKKSAPLAAQADPFAGDVSSQAALEAVSIPPVTDDISDEHFFSRDSSPPMADEDDDDETVKERALRQTPEVRARIARAQRIVMGLVGAAALVTFAGLGSKALRQTPSAQGVVAASPRSALVAEAPKPLEAKVELPKAPTNLEAPKAAEPATAEEPVKVAEKPAEPAKVEVAPSAAPSAADPATPTKTALEEKKDSQRALDRGKSKDAIASGERSVALDPADGEAWLILGAAYQEQGKMTDARRCYQACLKEGKRGPKGECAAMLH
jgi:tetratricopeptide (TPR) repeat protein